ncbi:hypothetical protein EI555_017954, partial [Monodon monoceros]
SRALELEWARGSAPPLARRPRIPAGASPHHREERLESTGPPLRSSQPPLSRKLTPRSRSRAACLGCRLRDLHGLGLRKDQHASRWLRGPPGLPAERGSAARIPRLFRAWWTCWDLPGGAASRALPGRGAVGTAPGAALGAVWSRWLGGDSSPGTLLARDLLHPSLEEEKKKHKKKRLVQSPNSYFMDVKCPGCYKITTVFSHAQTVVLCVGCSTVLCQPTGGKARLTE